MSRVKRSLSYLFLIVFLNLSFYAQSRDNEKDFEINKEQLKSFKSKHGITFEVVVLHPKTRIKKNHQVVHKFVPTMNNEIYAYFLVDKVTEKVFFQGLDISNNLREKFPPKVVVHLANNLINDAVVNGKPLDEGITKMLTALERILNSTWKTDLESYSLGYSDRKIYHRDFAGFKMNYYEFVPFQDTNFDTLLIEATTLLTHDYIIKKHDNNSTYITLPTDFRDKLHNDWSGSGQTYRYKRLKVIKEMIEDFKKYNANERVSNWKMLAGTGWKFDENGTGYTVRNDTTDHLYMEIHSVDKGEWMPNMAWTQNYFGWSESGIKEFWKATRCNVFAGDFSQEYLKLGSTPWGTTGWNADMIYKNLPGKDGFIPLDWSEIWTYTNSGFPVFITTPSSGQAGHIAIAYPISQEDATNIHKVENVYTKGKVVQAGATNGVMAIEMAWKNKEFFKNNAKAYVYLGYLLK